MALFILNCVLVQSFSGPHTKHATIGRVFMLECERVTNNGHNALIRRTEFASKSRTFAFKGRKFASKRRNPAIGDVGLRRKSERNTN